MIPVHEYLPDPRDEHVGVCMRCFFPLTKDQIAADLSGTWVDYINRRTISFGACVCIECAEAIQEAVNGGPEEAYRKLYVSSVLTKQAYDEVDEYFSNTTE